MQHFNMSISQPFQKRQEMVKSSRFRERIQLRDDVESLSSSKKVDQGREDMYKGKLNPR